MHRDCTGSNPVQIYLSIYGQESTGTLEDPELLTRSRRAIPDDFWSKIHWTMWRCEPLRSGLPRDYYITIFWHILANFAGMTLCISSYGVLRVAHVNYSP